MTPRGRLVTLEGGEGSGKSTQCGHLADHLRSRGLEVVVTREPGGTKGAEEIRGLLVAGEAARWDTWSEALLIAAARRDHVVRVIAPALERGAWVVCDRFVHSTLAYQGLVGGLGQEVLITLHRLTLGRLWPDLMLFLDLPVEEGLARAAKRAGGDASEARFEGRGLAFHQALREAFVSFVKEDPRLCRRIPARGSEAEVATTIAAAVATL
ncbi:MAG: dTMP kinase [Pseudomonadota bacterium]